MTYFASWRTLLLGWAALMLLTFGTATIGQAGVSVGLGPLALAGLALVTWIKAGVILRVYLNLRTAPVWADALMVVVGLALAMILAFFALPAGH